MLLPHVHLTSYSRPPCCIHILTSFSRSFYHVLGLITSHHVTVVSHTSFFFLKISNLLHGACRQTVVATFVTTYKRIKLYGKEKENRKRKEKETKEFKNENALGLNTKNMMKWLNESLLGFQYPLNLPHSYKIWHLVSMGYQSHRHLNSSLGKNLSLNSLIGAWFVMALVVYAQREFKWPKTFSHSPSLTYVGSIMLLSSSTRSKNCFSLRFEAWNIIFQMFKALLLLHFLLKSYEFLHEKRGNGWNVLVSLLTSLWRCHLRWLGHSQNSIELLAWQLKK